jgi:hypothetical protein
MCSRRPSDHLHAEEFCRGKRGAVMTMLKHVARLEVETAGA